MREAGAGLVNFQYGAFGMGVGGRRGGVTSRPGGFGGRAKEDVEIEGRVLMVDEV